MRIIKAICPASLSFIFKAVNNIDPLKTGSVGIGTTLDKNVTVIVSKNNSGQIFFNGVPISFPTVATVIKSLTDQNLKIDISSLLPLGYGFGISAASALASAFAANRLLTLGKSKEELIRIVHRAEIVNHTGLGSTVTAATGGFLLKTKAGIPTKTKLLPFTGQKLYAVIIDKLTTPTILTSEIRLRAVNNAAKGVLETIYKNSSLKLKDVIDLAYIFAVKAGLLTDKRVISVINDVRKTGKHATMAMLGQVVITDTIPRLKENYRVEELTVSEKTVTLI